MSYRNSKFFFLNIVLIFCHFEIAFSEGIDMSVGALRGLALSQQHCSRCHVISDSNPYGGIESTPSFFILRDRNDWQKRFTEFFIRPPHPSFINITDITEKRSSMLPSFISEINLTFEELEDILSFVSVLKRKD